MLRARVPKFCGSADSWISQPGGEIHAAELALRDVVLIEVAPRNAGRRPPPGGCTASSCSTSAGRHTGSSWP